MKSRCLPLGACVMLCLGPAPSRARQVGDGQVVLSGQCELSRLVDLAAQRLHLNVDYDAASLRGSVTLRLDGPLSDQDLWLLVNRLLASRGFTTIRTSGRSSYSVVKLADAAGLARTEAQGVDEPPAGFRAATVRLEHRSPKDALDAVSKVLSKPGGSATSLGDSGIILISDLSDRVDAAVAMLRSIDVAPGAIAAEEIQLRHLSAQAIVALAAQVSAKREAAGGAKLLGDVLPLPGGTSVLLVCASEHQPYWKDVISRLDQRQDVHTSTYSPRTFALREVGKLIEQTVKDAPPSDERFRLVIDELTGSLIVTATPQQHEQIGALVDRLNQAPAAGARPIRTFSIKNRPVHEMQAVLEQLLNAGIIGGVPTTEAEHTNPDTGVAPWPPPAPGSSRGSPPAPARPGGITPNPAGAAVAPDPLVPVSFTSDSSTNTLIAMGEPRALAQIEELLKSLDVRQPQVMLEVLIVSLNHGQTLDLGVELENFTTIGDVRIRLASLFGLGARGSGGDRTVGDGAGGTGLILSPGDFAILIRALQTINGGRSLSMPRILVANNQQGVLDSVLDVPYANTNASNTVTTTSFGGSRPAGTQVTIKPQIGSGDQLTLDYAVSLSSFTGAASSANLPPPRQENKVQSVATIPDGYTVALGGIELNTEGHSVSQVPLLAQIPILGEAFKNRSKNASNTRFYVFIRAGILRSNSFEDLKYLSESTSAAAGIDDGFPVVEPRIIR